MADKKAPADGWPVISGDYIVGDPESPVAVTTLASHIEAELSGAAIAGPCKTENLGIEKVVANIISNPNIRFLILAGAEVQGHITGQSFKALQFIASDNKKREENELFVEWRKEHPDKSLPEWVKEGLRYGNSLSAQEYLKLVDEYKSK